MIDEPTGGDLSRLRQLNAATVLRVLRADQPLTLTELSRRAGLSRASTEDVARDLLGRGWVTEVAPAAGTVGRPARRYRFHAEAGRLLGVDIGGHKVLALVTDLEGEVLHQARIAVAPELGRRERLAVLDKCVADALAGAGVERSQIWSTGVATTGLVDGTGKVMLSDSLPEWTGVDLAAHLRRLVPGPVRVENDCKLAALAESWRGVARYAKDVVFLLAGLRTGAGLIIDGKLHRGFANWSGEIGALPAAGWLRAPEHLRNWLGADDSGDDVERVFLAARDGDREAMRAVRGYVRDIAVGASALVLTLDPEVVVIGGGFSRSADVLVEPLRRELDRWCLRTPEIRVSAFADLGVALGAVRLALEQVESTVYNGLKP
ncbi:ROK family transcriptional regulator [Kribbella sp. NPDC051952]|uniref:ROK family transcriptional regulator n=1 Tax=Kribbella sp. NPDC051952 TaxID=3154851 RepID=UPI003442E440